MRWSTILSWDGLHNNIVKHESPECNKATPHPKGFEGTLRHYTTGFITAEVLTVCPLCRGGGTFELVEKNG